MIRLYKFKATPNLCRSSETLKQTLDAFNRHDIDAITDFFSDDCSFDFQRDQTFVTTLHRKAWVREALEGRFKGIPDVHYGDDRHWFHQMEMGVSDWDINRN